MLLQAPTYTTILRYTYLEETKTENIVSLRISLIRVPMKTLQSVTI
jgi:hypothetical protein